MEIVFSMLTLHSQASCIKEMYCDDDHDVATLPAGSSTETQERGTSTVLSNTLLGSISGVRIKSIIVLAYY